MVTQWGVVPESPSSVLGAAEGAAARIQRGYRRTFYVDNVEGNDGSSGRTWSSPLATMARAAALVQTFDQIVFRGVVDEEVTFSNLLGGISIIGFDGQPRHGDSPWGGGNLWKPPASEAGTTPLAKIRSQGFYFENFLMDAPTDAACVELERNALSGTSEYDASHFSCDGMRFVGGQSGIEVDGGAFNVKVRNSVFQSLTNGIKILGTGVSVPLQWLIENNEFMGNTNDILGPFTDSTIKENRFHTAGSGSTNKVVDTSDGSSQGARNFVIGNWFHNPSAEIKNNNGYRGTSTDHWANHGEDTAALIVESPPGAS